MSPIFDELITAATAADWTKVDTELIPQLRVTDGNEMAIKLLEKVGDSNPDIRDVVASSLNALDIKDREILSKSVQEMINMAGTDQERFPAGRAAIFLWSHRSDETLKDKINEGIEKFKSRPEIAGWRKELLDNIPQLTEVLK